MTNTTVPLPQLPVQRPTYVYSEPEMDGQLVVTNRPPEGDLPVFTLEGEVDPNAVFLGADGVLYLMPPQPAPHMTWSAEAEAWVDLRSEAQMAEAFAAARDAAQAGLLAACSAFEARFVTLLPAQAMKYERKEAEARAFLAADDPDPDDYPWIAAEVGITAPTAWEVAQIYVNLAAQWTAVACRYEPIRLASSAAIDAAQTPADLQAAVEGFAAAMQALVISLQPRPAIPLEPAP